VRSGPLSRRHCHTVERTGPKPCWAIRMAWRTPSAQKRDQITEAYTGYSVITQIRRIDGIVASGRSRSLRISRNMQTVFREWDPDSSRGRGSPIAGSCDKLGRVCMEKRKKKKRDHHRHNHGSAGCRRSEGGMLAACNAQNTMRRSRLSASGGTYERDSVSVPGRDVDSAGTLIVRTAECGQLGCCHAWIHDTCKHCRQASSEAVERIRASSNSSSVDSRFRVRLRRTDSVIAGSRSLYLRGHGHERVSRPFQ